MKWYLKYIVKYITLCINRINRRMSTINYKQNMYKKGVLSFLILTVLMLSFSCKQEQKEERIVTVTIEPQRYFAEKIAGDKFKINTMVPVGSSPESFDPSQASMVKLNESKAYFWSGKIGLETTGMDKLKKNYPDVKVYNN